MTYPIFDIIFHLRYFERQNIITTYISKNDSKWMLKKFLSKSQISFHYEKNLFMYLPWI
jgi:hypothetical protein